MNTALLIASIFLILSGSIILLIEQFRVSIIWGLVGIFLPILSLVFICKYWKVSRLPVFIEIAGFIILALHARFYQGHT